MDPSTIEHLNFLERYVNDGSPTGLTFLHSSSDCTSPFYGTPGFVLPILWLEQHLVQSGGFVPDFLKHAETLGLPVHPDCWKFVCLKRRRAGTIHDTILVSPTASARTVLYADYDYPLYFKLHYPFVLGRFSAELRDHKLRLPVIISQALTVRNEQLDEISFLPDIGWLEASDACQKPCDGKLGVLVRSAIPFNCPPLDTVLPFFSLHARSHLGKDERSLLQSMTDDFEDKAQHIIDSILRPLISSFWNLVGKFGLWPEAHGQNILIGYEPTQSVGHVVWRDFQGFYRERDISKRLLGQEYEEVEYHLLPIQGEELLKKRSQLYDSYLGEYCLKPLLAEFDSEARETARSFVIEQTRYFIAKFQIELPRRCWYALPLRPPREHEKLLLQKHTNPSYR